MNAIGRNIIIKKLKEGVTETKGGLLLAESHREEIFKLADSLNAIEFKPLKEYK